MRPPKFWSNSPSRPGVAAHLLGPFSAIVGAVARRRIARSPAYAPQIPVICVGNLVVGGAGKTPTVLALCERLSARGLSPHVISRGYGGRAAGGHLVDPDRDSPSMVGDEPLLLAAHAPTWVGRDRVASAKAAEDAGADILIMDDGFQNPSLAKDLSLVVVDAATGYGNGRLLPAGPLREPLDQGFARADAAVIVGDPAPSAPQPWTPSGLPRLQARIAPRPTGLPLAGAPVVAFAGIGRPQKFFETLKGMGARVLDAIALPDHHRYDDKLLKRLELRAASLGAMLVTTEKDAVKFPTWFRGRATVLPIALGFANPAGVDLLLDRVAPRAAQQSAGRTER